MTSNSSVGDTPACGQHVMLRTELPHASRVVRPGIGEDAHRGLDVVQLDEMKLDVLPRRDVAEPAREPLADFGQRLELRRGEDALRNLDAQHLHVAGLPLAVGAAHETEHPPLVGRQLAASRTSRAWRRTRRCRPRSRTRGGSCPASWDRLLLPCVSGHYLTFSQPG